MNLTGYNLKNYNWEPTPASTIETGGYAGPISTEGAPSYVYPRQDVQLIVPFNKILTKVDLLTKSGQVYSLKKTI